MLLLLLLLQLLQVFAPLGGCFDRLLLRNSGRSLRGPVAGGLLRVGPNGAAVDMAGRR